MLKSTILSCLLLAVLSACDPKIDPALSCNVSDPIHELAWLKAKVDTIRSYNSGRYEIKLVKFKGEGYINIEDAFSSSPGSNIYNCNGESALGSLNVSYNYFMDHSKTLKILYQSR